MRLRLDTMKEIGFQSADQAVHAYFVLMYYLIGRASFRQRPLRWAHYADYQHARAKCRDQSAHSWPRPENGTGLARAETSSLIERRRPSNGMRCNLKSGLPAVLRANASE